MVFIPAVFTADADAGRSFEIGGYSVAHAPSAVRAPVYGGISSVAVLPHQHIGAAKARENMA